jgi:hypothetical protein
MATHELKYSKQAKKIGAGRFQNLFPLPTDREPGCEKQGDLTFYRRNQSAAELKFYFVKVCGSFFGANLPGTSEPPFPNAP